MAPALQLLWKLGNQAFSQALLSAGPRPAVPQRKSVLPFWPTGFLSCLLDASATNPGELCGFSLTHHVSVPAGRQGTLVQRWRLF